VAATKTAKDLQQIESEWNDVHSPVPEEIKLLQIAGRRNASTEGEYVAREVNAPRWLGRQGHALAGFVSGLLLMLPGVFPALAPLQAVAFVPLLVALRHMKRWRQCLHAGFLMGLGFVAPQILLLQLPAAISLMLALYYVVLLTVLVVGSWAFFRPTAVWGCVAFGAFAAVLDWVTVTALPVWGTAQSFVRCWSWYPGAVAFTAVTGMPGVIFVLAVTQALAVDIALDRRDLSIRVAVLAGVLIVVTGIDVVTGLRKPTGRLTVAAIGWATTAEQRTMRSSGAFDRLYAEQVAKAAQQGARLVVTPEAAFAVYDDPARDPFATQLELAREHSAYLALGYLDTKSRENRIAFIGPTEGIIARYAKVHLTPFESNPTGTGRPVLVMIDGISVGAMICHDDNYTDIPRRYGRKATDIVVVPTEDWGPVRKAHFQSSIHRAIESSYAIVRAAFNGISAIISPKGKRLAVSDHLHNSPNLLVAEVPVYTTRTLFSRFGHWFVLSCVILLVARIVTERSGHGRRIGAKQAATS
jgi:apolipoprotein N-acyltransferase